MSVGFNLVLSCCDSGFFSAAGVPLSSCPFANKGTFIWMGTRRNESDPLKGTL